jgi:putative ABC transport system permease protein
MADRIYRTLLLILPGWFREEFGAEMSADFRDSLRDARRDGPVATARLWLATTRDVVALSARLRGDAVAQDLRYAVRSLVRTPAFTVAAIGTLALGLGPTMIVANLVERVVVRPLPFDRPDQLVAVWNAQPDKGRHEFPLSAPDYVDFRDRQDRFAALAAHTGTSVAFVGTGEPRQVGGVLTTSDLHAVLGVQPRLGRGLTREDSAPGAPPVIVLGHTFWTNEFGARPTVVGETVTVDGAVTEIVGVLPDGVEYPSGSENYWVPLTLDPAQFNRGSHFLSATGRLGPGVTAAQASDALNGVARALAEAYPSTNTGQSVELVDLKRQLNGDAPRLLAILGGAIAAVLLIACTNVASLLAVRASIRGTELAVRTAIGATGRRLRHQLLIEHLLLAGGGGVLAVVMAVPLHRVLLEQRVLALPKTAPTLAWPSYVALALVVIAIGALFSWLTARRSSRDGLSLLRTTRSTGGRPQLRLRQTLVVVEVAAALVLVVVAGLMIRSASRLAAVNPGFDTAQVLTFGVVLPGTTYQTPALRLQFVNRVIDKLRELPGVVAATSGGYAPMGQMRATRRYAPADRPPPPAGAEPLALDLTVNAGYFEVMGITLRAGRTFDSRDGADSPPVLIVSETFAREVFPGESAIGKRIGFYASRPGATPPPSREIVGIVQDVRQDGVSRRPIPQMYAPYAQSAWAFTSFFLKVNGDPATVAASVQRAVSSVDPMRPVRDVLTTGQIVQRSTARQRAMTALLLGLAGIALLLATLGLYGVSATAAEARSREMAIRAAVGAEPGMLLRLLLRQGLVTGAIGVAIGAAASLAATRGLGAFLYETEPRDPVTFAVTAALLLTIAAIATTIPARRAMATSPAEVLRAE